MDWDAGPSPGYLPWLVSPDHRVDFVQTEGSPAPGRVWPPGMARCARPDTTTLVPHPSPVLPGAALFLSLPLGVIKHLFLVHPSDTCLSPETLKSLWKSAALESVPRCPDTCWSCPGFADTGPQPVQTHNPPWGSRTPLSPRPSSFAQHSQCSVNTCVGPHFPTDTTAVPRLAGGCRPKCNPSQPPH